MMNGQMHEAISALTDSVPEAYAFVRGSSTYASVKGEVYFYPFRDGTLVAADVRGLPYPGGACPDSVLGFHIHEGAQCLPLGEDPFGKAGMHYNPGSCEHPFHAGDLPPLFVNHGTAWMVVYTDRFMPQEVIGKTVIIHSQADDFRTQPSGDSGIKIACGEIRMNKM